MAERPEPEPDRSLVEVIEPGDGRSRSLPPGAEVVRTEIIRYVQVPSDGFPAPVGPSTEPDPGDGRLSPLVLGLGLLVLVALLAFGLYARNRAGREQVEAVSEALDEPVISDDFERSSAEPLDGPAPAGAEWSSLGAAFEVVDGTATVASEPVGETALAILDSGWSDQTVGVTVERAASGAGVVFRFVDLFNYWSLVASPEFGTWNLVLTVDGEVSQSASTGLTSTDPGTRLTIVTDGPRIRVFVDGIPTATVIDPTFELASAAGLLATAGDGAAFSELFVIAGLAAAADE